MKNKIFNYIKKNKLGISIITGVFLLMVLPIFNSKSILTMLTNNGNQYTEEIKSVDIPSEGYQNSTMGSWNVKKSAEWTGPDSAKITFELDSIMKTSSKHRDVIMMLDVSGSMEEDGKIDAVRADTLRLIEEITKSSKNRMCLMKFSNSATKLIEFTNEARYLKDRIQTMRIDGLATNYAGAMNLIRKEIDSYKRRDNTDLVVIFLTDGWPNVGQPYEIEHYKEIKRNHPYVQIIGIQYEMGDKISKDIVNISDYQYAAKTTNIGEILHRAAFRPNIYDEFEITDFINNDYFTVESDEDLVSSVGKASLKTENGKQKVVWNLDDSATGFTAKLEINVKLKEQYVNTNGFYPTNTGESIKYSLDGTNKTVNSDKTPVLKSYYTVTYDANTPSGCNIANETEEHYIYQNVNIKDTKLECNGYQFKGWKLATKVKKVNDNVFVMPGNDVIIRGTWTKVSVNKKVSGTVKEANFVINDIKEEANKSNGYVVKRTSNVTDTYNKTETKDLYFYRGSNPNNNVVFGNYCWQIYRTTATGGYKMIYNGTPTINTVYDYDDLNPSYMDIRYLTYFAWDSDNYRWYSTNHENSSTGYMTFSPRTEGKYYIKYEASSEQNYDKASFYKNDSLIQEASGTEEGIIDLGVLSTSDVIKVEYSKDSSVSSNSDTIKFNLVNYKGTHQQAACNATESSNYIANDYFQETNNAEALEYVGYMIPNTIKYKQEAQLMTSSSYLNHLFGSGFTYNNGKYTLTDPQASYDVNHKYTCNNTTGTCTNIRFVYSYTYDTTNNIKVYVYVGLSDGESIEDALNNSYNVNVNQRNSKIKNIVDNWYRDHLTNYTNYIEDTVYCNDRSFLQQQGFTPSDGAYSIGGINGLGVYFNGWHNDLNCARTLDQFSLSNPQARLTYPIGLISAQEARVISNLGTPNFLQTSNTYWTISPQLLLHGCKGTSIFTSSLNETGLFKKRVRPVITMKPTVQYSTGDGSISNPYVMITE